MSENKKFLDEEGVKVLWNQINLNDYPNNETLIAVLNAIDETKVDKDGNKVLSTNDFTNEYKTKLDNLIIDTIISDTSTNPVQNKVIKSYIDSYEFITTDDIDAICGTTILLASEEGVTF